MDNFKIIYKILSTLEKAMDLSDFDTSIIGYETLGITKERFESCIEMLLDDGYITGVSVIKSISGKSLKFTNIKITIKGLEYLTQNEIMKKMSNSAKGFIE